MNQLYIAVVGVRRWNLPYDHYFDLASPLHHTRVSFTEQYNDSGKML